VLAADLDVLVGLELTGGRRSGSEDELALDRAPLVGADETAARQAERTTTANRTA
jgi:hypothetical protein